MGLFKTFNKGLAVEVLQQEHNANQKKEKKPFLYRVVSFIAKILIGIELLKYLAMGVLFSGFLFINNIKALLGLIEKSQVYVNAATSVNHLIDLSDNLIESIDIEVHINEEPVYEYNSSTKNELEYEYSNSLHSDVIKNKDKVILDLKRMGLISNGGNELNFEVEDFRELKMSLRNTDDMNAIAQIYAYELAVKEYDSEAVDNYYKGIKCRYEDRYFESKEDFYTSIGCANEIAYSNMVEEYIISKNGDVGLCAQNNTRLSNSNNPKLARNNNYSFSYNNEDRGTNLVDLLRQQKQEQSYNMNSKALGSYHAKRLYR